MNDEEFEETYKLYLEQKENIAVCKAICDDLAESIPSEQEPEEPARV